MRKILTILTLIILSVFISCSDDDCSLVICDSGPYYGDLNVLVTINDENPDVELVIYEGKIERNDTVIYDVLNESNMIYELIAGKYYSGTVIYQDGIKEILAINGRSLDITTDDCDCKRGANRRLNLRLAK